MKISLVNHASLLYEAPNLNLLSDPWYSGRLFGDSWELTADTPQTIRNQAIESASHVYISHEHPDHFHPPTLRDSFGKRSNSPEFLIPQTIDGRMSEWLRHNNFRFRELGPLSKLQIGNWQVQVIPHATYDSYLVLRSGGQVIIRLGYSKPHPRQIAKLLNNNERIVAIATQFSIASWPGNPKDSVDVEAGRRIVKSYLLEIVKELRPEILFPFASHVHFCHPENVWMNSHGLTLEEVANLETPQTQIPILVPGDSIEIPMSGRRRVSTTRREASLQYWQESSRRRAADAFSQRSVEQVSLDVLTKNFEGFVSRTKTSNNSLLLTLYRRLTCRKAVVSIYITDLRRQIQLNFSTGSLSEPLSSKEGFLSMSSDALSRALASPHGADEFTVAGRFEGSRINAELLHSLLAIETLNRAGIKLKLRYFLRPRFLLSLLRIFAGYWSWRRLTTG